MQRTAAIVAMLALTIAATACGSSDTSAENEPRTDMSPSSTLVWCQTLDRDKFPTETATPISADEIAAAGCTTSSGDAAPAAAALIIPAGTDRSSMELIDATPTSYEVSITAPGPDCMVTMDWRGDMALLVDAPDVSTAADVTVRRVDEPCGS